MLEVLAPIGGGGNRFELGLVAQTRLRHRRGTLSQLRRCLEDYRHPFDTLRIDIEDPPVIVKILSQLGLSTRAPPRAPARVESIYSKRSEEQKTARQRK